jgi:hypothetical protein
MTTHQLDDIISVLNTHRQRATYSAVAKLVGKPPRGLMQGRAREPGNSWIVSKATGRPSGYPDSDVHPELTANEHILRTGEELAAWLATH